MSSPTTSPRPAASTSTAATGSTKAPAAVRVGLRKKGATLTAIQATQPAKGTLADGTDVVIRVGEWVLYAGSSPVATAVIPAAEFPGIYEIVAEGTLTLSKHERELIEAATGIGTTGSGASLISGIQRLARIAIGDVQIPFTPGQLEELQHRAEKRGQTVQQAVQAVIDRIRDEIFHRG